MSDIYIPTITFTMIQMNKLRNKNLKETIQYEQKFEVFDSF